MKKAILLLGLMAPVVHAELIIPDVTRSSNEHGLTVTYRYNTDLSDDVFTKIATSIIVDEALDVCAGAPGGKLKDPLLVIVHGAIGQLNTHIVYRCPEPPR